MRRPFVSATTGLPGVQRAKARLTALLKSVENDPTEILEKEAIKTQMQAISETPYKTGALEHSVYVRVSRNKRKPGFLIGARAHNPKDHYNYAWIQHEETSFRHPIKGKAKFLEDPFKRAIRRILYKFRKIGWR